jgi:hypothetical protein
MFEYEPSLTIIMIIHPLFGQCARKRIVSRRQRLAVGEICQFCHDFKVILFDYSHGVIAGDERDKYGKGGKDQRGNNS